MNTRGPQLTKDAQCDDGSSITKRSERTCARTRNLCVFIWSQEMVSYSNKLLFTRAIENHPKNIQLRHPFIHKIHSVAHHLST